MEDLSKKLNGSTLEIEINEQIYSKETVLTTCHKFADKFNIQVAKKADKITLSITPKQGNMNAISIYSNFHNELLDQQVRLNVEKSYGNIRDLIVKQAFSPIDNIQNEIKL